MNDLNKCPRCGTEPPAGSTGGVCPRCAAGLLQATQTDIPGENTGGFIPPTVEELAAKFPQLEIIELIGRGGMGAVYKARQRELDRLVALKILPPAIGQSPAFAERFSREARALAKLNHPGIITIHDFGRADGLYFFLMEFVDGMNLRELLHNGRISAREALAIVPQICDALQFAHDQGIVHRDIKPENLLIDRRGRVKVADFGLAKLMGTEPETAATAGSAPPSTTLTEAGKVMGTPNYMSPEQLERPGEVDHRADIYALGVVFYQMLTGELPDKQLQPPSRKVQIDVRLDEVVMRALEQQPDRRYQHASAMKTQVDTIAQGTANSAQPVPPQWYRGVNYKSKRTFFGLPLVHVASGMDPATGRARIARGIIAIGGIAQGVVAIGGVAMGGFTMGGFSLGVFSYGGLALGLFALGGVAAALVVAFGGLAVAPVSLGGLAIGYYSKGGLAIGLRTVDARGQMPAAVHFFTPWSQWVLDHFQIFNFLLVTVTCVVASGVPWWLSRRSGRSAPDEPGSGASSPRQATPPSGGTDSPKERQPAEKKAVQGSLFKSWTFLMVVVLFIACGLAAVFEFARELQERTILTQEQFLDKFRSGQITHFVISYNPQSFPLTEIRGSVITGTNSGGPTETSFISPRMMLTPKMQDELFASPREETEVHNAMLWSIGYQLLFFIALPALILTIILTILVLAWRLRRRKTNPNVQATPPSGGTDSPKDARPTEKKTAPRALLKSWTFVGVATLFIASGLAAVFQFSRELLEIFFNRDDVVIDGFWAFVIALPIGVGLLRRGYRWRIAAVAFLWLCFFALFLISGLALTAQDLGIFARFSWHSHAVHGLAGDLIKLFLYTLMIGLLVWMYRALSRADIKGQFIKLPLRCSWVEWGVLTMAMIIALTATLLRLLNGSDRFNETLTNSSFGPAVDRVFHFGVDDSALDLGSGEYVTRADGMEPVDWMLKGQKADVMPAVWQGQTNLFIRDVWSAPRSVPNAVWDKPWLMNDKTIYLMTNQPSPKIQIPAGAFPVNLMQGRLPATFVFHTLHHGSGLLQITGTTVNPPGVTIRYKLLGSSSPAPTNSTPTTNADETMALAFQNVRVDLALPVLIVPMIILTVFVSRRWMRRRTKL